MKLPTFPNFKQIELADKKYFDSYTKNFAPYSDFNFNSLWSYDVGDSAEFTILNDNLVIKMKDYLEDFHFLTFLGVNRPVETISTLLKFANEKNLHHALKLVPEENLKTDFANLNEIFVLKEERDHFDYIISINETLSLKGNKYKKIRKKVTKFINAYPHYEVRLLDLNLKQSQDDVIELFKKWAQNRDPNETETEFKATLKILTQSDILELISIGIYVDNTIVGYTISDALYNKYCTGLFGSYDYAYDGVMQVAEIETLRLFKKMGCTHINIEQDLGIQNLRSSKESWQPEYFLKKFEISYK